MSKSNSSSDNSLEDKLLRKFDTYREFCMVMIDGYAVVTPNGKVLKANQLLGLLVGKKAKQILKSESLDDLIQFYINNKKIPINTLLRRHDVSRIDEVKGVTSYSDSLNLIIGIFPFFDEKTFLGSFLMIRDVTAETNLQDKYHVKSTQSVTDKLTGLYNRTYFEDTVPQIIKDQSSTNLTSVLMADIDHFKQVNDTYGHQAGDYVIKNVASILTNNCRKTDIICRYGGEEFLIIFPQTKIKDANIAAEKLRAAIELFNFNYDETPMPITISLGLAEVENVDELQEAIKKADEALYHSKENGRNKVSFNVDGKIT